MALEWSRVSGSEPLDARRYIQAGTTATIDFAALVEDMATRRKAAHIPAGSWLAKEDTVLLDSVSATFAYRFFGDVHGGTRISFPAGMSSSDYLFSANSGSTATFYPHPDIIFEDMTLSGGSSPDGSWLHTYNRSVSIRRVNITGMLNGVVTSGFCDLSYLEQFYVEHMTAGGWGFSMTSHGDAVTVNSMMTYDAAGLRIVKGSVVINGLVGGFHEFVEANVDFRNVHLEGDGPSGSKIEDPLLTLHGGTYTIDDSRLYTLTNPDRPAIEIDDSGLAGRKTNLTLGRNCRFTQRLDDPANGAGVPQPVGAAQGVAIHITNLGVRAEIRFRETCAEIYGQTTTNTRLVYERIAPIYTSDDADIQAVFDARQITLCGDVTLRHGSDAWEVRAPHPFSDIRSMRKLGTPLLQVSAGTGSDAAANPSTLTTGTYYYKAQAIDTEGFTTLASTEQSQAITAGSTMPVVSVSAVAGPFKLRLFRGTSAGTYTHWVEVFVHGHEIELWDQGTYIAGQAWSATAVPTPSAANTTVDGIRQLGPITGRKIIWASAIPTGGTYVAGDTVFYTAPTAGASPGAVCVTGGTPGTWKAMAAIAA